MKLKNNNEYHTAQMHQDIAQKHDPKTTLVRKLRPLVRFYILNKV